MALRTTLLNHGIPADWISIEMQSSVSGKGASQCHVRLQVRHWEPQLLQYMVAFQNSLSRRIRLLDADAGSWLRSIGWHFALQDDTVCPDIPRPAPWSVVAKMVEPREPKAQAVDSKKLKESRFDKLHQAMEPRDNRLFAEADFQDTQPFAQAAVKVTR